MLVKIDLVFVLLANLASVLSQQSSSVHTSSSTSSTQQSLSNKKPVLTKCSRTQSKFVREYFARMMLPVYNKYKLPVPEKCPFSPLHDIYHLHENNKTKLDVNKWKCEICGKTFIDESHLDLHLENKHNDSLQINNNSVCLASYCRMFRCDVLMSLSSLANKKCYDNVMNNLRHRCIHHLDACIPANVPYGIRNKLTTELRDSVCSYLTCSRYKELPTYMSSGPSFIIVFIVVIFAGLCLIAYGVITHTDLIYDEREVTHPLLCEDQETIEKNENLMERYRLLNKNKNAEKKTSTVNESFLRQRLKNIKQQKISQDIKIPKKDA